MEFFKATFVAHAYSRHTHDDYAIAVTERGVQTYRCRGSERLARAWSFSLINPGEPHDGRPATEGGYRYRMLYVSPTALTRLLGDEEGSSRRGRLPFFKGPVAEDRSLAAEYLVIHRAMEDGSVGALEAESRLLTLLARVFARHADWREGASRLRHTPLVRSVCQHLEHYLHTDPSLSDLSVLTGLSRFQLLRQFTRETGLPPHAYLTQVRLREARRLLRSGEAPALVAPTVGLVDQSHLTKRFRSAFGITPGQYVAATRPAPSGEL